MQRNSIHITRLFDKILEIYPVKKSGKTRSRRYKMATNTNNTTIAAELLGEINRKPYVAKVAPLSLEDKLSDNVFQMLKRATSNKYVYSYNRFCTKKGADKPAGLFEIFSDYSGKTASEVRSDMIQYVSNNKQQISDIANEYFVAKRQHLEMWIAIMIREKNAGDELALFLLCKLHNRHAVIYNRAKVWTTLCMKTTISLDQLCDIVLVYRNNGFCEAIRKMSTDVATPSIPKKQKRKTTSIKDILEEAKEREDSTVVNTVSAQVSAINILPDGPRYRNTRDPIPLRRRSSSRSQRDTQKNRNYSDNIDVNQLDQPSHKRKKVSVASKLREPSSTRQHAQRLLTSSQLQKSAPIGKTRTIIRTVIKEEDKKPKLESELDEADERKLEALHRAQNKQRPWSTDAKLIHIDGTSCSQICMKDPNSRYHSDTVELQDATQNKSEQNVEIPDPRTHRTMSQTTDLESNNQRTNSNRVELEVATDRPDMDHLRDEIPFPDNDQLKELNGATPNGNTNNTAVRSVDGQNLHNLKISGLDNVPTEDKTDHEMDLAELSDATQENIENIENEINLQSDGSEVLQVNTTLKQYDIRKEITSTGTRNSIQLEQNVTDTIEHDLTLTMNSAGDSNTMLADLPLLEHYDELNDFESLLTLADDVDNSELVPIDGPPQQDVVRELNNEYRINSDLELAMDNAMFIDEHLLKTMSKKANNKRQTKNPTRVIHTSTPGSPKGRLVVKTHGLRKMGPEERQDKQFKCTSCEFRGYSQASASVKNHGVVYCETCGKECPNPHALKRHEYVHSEDKQYVCKNCKESFFFESELKNHRVKHRTGKSFFCMYTGCGKTFRRNSDLNAHVESHTGKIWYCNYDDCDYSNTDRRLLKGHKRTHQKATFHCKYDGCEEVFKHTMARLRHYNRDH